MDEEEKCLDEKDAAMESGEEEAEEVDDGKTGESEAGVCDSDEQDEDINQKDEMEGQEDKEVSLISYDDIINEIHEWQFAT